jgi:hypothetical protein
MSESPARRRLRKIATQFESDVEYLNERKVHIVVTRDEHGRRQSLSPQTVHAIADVVRLLEKKPTGE